MPKRTDAGWDQERPYDDLADYDRWWWPYWQAMPEYLVSDIKKYHTLKIGLAGRGEKPVQVINVHFDGEQPIREFGEAIGAPVTRETKGVWFPHEPPSELTPDEARAALARRIQRTVTPQTRGMWFPHDELTLVDKRYCAHVPGAEPAPGDPCTDKQWPVPQFPIYVPSKGRWDSRKTVRALEAIHAPYRVVVEPQEYDRYAAVIDPSKILVMDRWYGQGLHMTRNWIVEHAAAEGHAWYWQLDDNIRDFYRFNYNLKTPACDASIFRAAEDFVQRYDNVAQGGFNYFMFILRKEKRPPITLNTRIYSCTLNRSLPFRYRYKFNDDTDYSLQVLKDGWGTVLFNAFLAHKETTMTVRGGNTDMYQGEGRLQMAQQLAEAHPDVVRVTRKWGRYQHHVDYRPFADNGLQLRPEFRDVRGVDDYGMVLEHLEADGAWRRLAKPLPYRI